MGDIAWGLTMAALAAAVALLLRRDVDYSDRGGELRARAHMEKVAAAQMRDLLMASTSHDLKTPLASIRLLTHLIRRDAEKGNISAEHLRERAGLIELNIQKMSSLIGELLDVARLHGGADIDLQPAATDLAPLVQKVAASFELTAGKHRIVVDAAEPHMVGVWDANRIERVLTNLVGNGLKYSPDGGDVTVRLGREQRHGGNLAVVTVSDEGVGVPARDLPHIFEWFHRGSNVGDVAGTGVGLPSAKLIVEKHGGTIDVSSHQGRGTTVTLRLPVQAAAQREDVTLAEITPPAREQLAASPE
jgi:signal transduction histidine kinase